MYITYNNLLLLEEPIEKWSDQEIDKHYPEWDGQLVIRCKKCNKLHLFHDYIEQNFSISSCTCKTCRRVPFLSPPLINEAFDKLFNEILEILSNKA